MEILIIDQMMVNHVMDILQEANKQFLISMIHLEEAPREVILLEDLQMVTLRVDTLTLTKNNL